MKRFAVAALALFAGSLAVHPDGASAGSWPKRMGNPQNTSNVGSDPALTPTNVTDLAVVEFIPTSGTVNATPVVSDGLLFVGDGGPTGRFFYVFDLDNGNAPLVKLDTGATVSTPLIGNGVQSTALFATVTVPDGNGGTREEKRVYFGANVKPKSFWCLDVERILTDRAALAQTPSDGASYLCEGADWPIMIAGLGDVETNDTTSPLPVYNASPVFRKAQEILVGERRDTLPVLSNVSTDPVEGYLERRDVIFTPTIGADCSDGQLWAIDAYTADVLWIFDPVPNFQDVAQNPAPVGPGYGGMIWTVPAFSRDGKHLYVTTGDCVEQPQLGFMAESLISLDPVYGTVQWYHQRRLTDTSDYDIGNSPVVADVEGVCHNVVSSDKNGCIYGFRQEGDIPQVGDPGFDPTRINQQRVLWRTCLVPGSLGGGFNASGVSVHDRTAFAQAASVGGRVPGDDVNAFAVDACDGTFRWATSSVSAGSGEGAIASGMWFQPSGSRLQVIRAEPTPAAELLATVTLPSGATPGGGGPAIVDGAIYMPTRTGVAVLRVQPGSNGAQPQPEGENAFGGPYPIPVGTGVEQVMMPIDPYDPLSPAAGPPETWPSMNP